MKTSAIMLAALLPVSALAAPGALSLGGQSIWVGNDAASGSGFDDSFRFEGFALLPLSPLLAVELGAATTTTTTDADEDNQGRYQLDVSSDDLGIGLRLDLPLSAQLGGYGRAGLLYYYSDLHFEESFFGIKPGGELDEVEEGSGYYLDAGLTWRLSPLLQLQSGLTWRVRRDYFEDSSRPFDMTELGVGVGAVFTFR